MKNFLIHALLLSSFSTFAQKKEAYYDYNWKPRQPEAARFFSLTEKTDSGWLRKDYFLGTMQLQMQALYEDSDCKIRNGSGYYFHANGNPYIIGHMKHNKQDGIYLRYHYNGMIADSALYHNGALSGSRILWHNNGYMSDSIQHLNDSTDVHVSWFDNGNVSSAGYLLHGERHCKWQFFHRNGKIAAEETYDIGKALLKKFYNEDGTSHTDTLRANRDAAFKNGGLNGWRSYLSKNVYWPDGYRFNNGNMAVVVVELTINEEGKPEDVFVAVPFHKEFDKIALRAVSGSPAWNPAMANNRKVKQRLRQPVTFQEKEE